MIKTGLKKRPLAAFIPCSLLLHLVGLFVVGRGGIFEFTPPVVMKPPVDVNLVEPGGGTHREERRKNAVQGPVGPDMPTGKESSGRESITSDADISPDREPEPKEEAAVTVPMPAATGQEVPISDSAPTEAPAPTPPVATTGRLAKLRLNPPLRKGSEFLAAVRERLTYRIVMFGIPVGEAVLEAANSARGFTITTRVTSNAAISSVYPVDDLVEIQLVCGNYLVTRISQHEGSYSRNSGFTLMLRERKAFSLDRLRGRLETDPLPREDVLDLISGFYFLRNQPVEVGKSMLLHLYDGNAYTPTVVEVPRSERIHVSGLGEVETLVVHPLLTTPGFFRRTGEILVWLTADAYKVPVRMQTSIALGKVTAELVSAEVER